MVQFLHQIECFLFPNFANKNAQITILAADEAVYTLKNHVLRWYKDMGKCIVHNA